MAGRSQDCLNEIKLQLGVLTEAVTGLKQDIGELKDCWQKVADKITDHEVRIGKLEQSSAGSSENWKLVVGIVVGVISFLIIEVLRGHLQF